MVVKSLSHTQDIINSDLSAPVCARVCAYAHKMCLRILSNPSGLMALTKETNRMVLGTLLEVFPRNRTPGKAGGLVQLKVDAGGGRWGTDASSPSVQEVRVFESDSSLSTSCKTRRGNET